MGVLARLLPPEQGFRRQLSLAFSLGIVCMAVALTDARFDRLRTRLPGRMGPQLWLSASPWDS
jgi:hypothetical protein